jgi:uncharacterized protein (TIGR02466 family)
MNYTVSEIFPTPIYQSSIDSSVLTRYQLDLYNLCDKYTLPRNSYENDHNYDYERRHVLDKFPELKNHLQEHLNLFCKNIIGEREDKFSLYITTSWCVGINPGFSQQVHQHENSIVSGVMYFMNEDDASEISFVRDVSVSFNSQLNLNPSNGTKFTYKENRIKPKNGSLLLFPAHLKHKVLEHNGKQRRNCLAFDSFVTGTIGDRRTLLTI